MAKYRFVIDVEKCTGCHSCFLACKDEYIGNDYLPTAAAQPEKGHTWIKLNETEQGQGTKIKVDYIPVMCQQCADTPCAVAAPAGAVYKRADGIVIIDPEKAKGCKAIVNSCPYRAVYWNDEKNLPQKCTMCAHMLDNGEKTTRCAEACPTGALVFGDTEDKNSAISRILAEKAGRVEVFKPELAVEATTKYINLPKPFIAGEVLLADRPGECLKGAKVTLTAKEDDTFLLEVQTDVFGDFEFKNLESNKNYIIKAEYEGYYFTELTVRTYASQNLGEIVLNPR
ncbi:MAG: bthL [Firmicutes bacterium]|nr:bthL [Bacillota bacterium]